MPNSAAYLNGRLKGNDFTKVSIAAKPGRSFLQSGISRRLQPDEYCALIENVSYFFMPEPSFAAGEYSSQNVDELLKINPYEGILAIAHLLNHTICNKTTKFTALTIHSLFDNVDFNKSDKDLLDAFIILFKTIKKLNLSDITLNDALMDFLLEVKKQTGEGFQVNIIPKKLTLTFNQLIKYIDLFSESFSLTCAASSTYVLDENDENQSNCLSISASDFHTSISATQLRNILWAKTTNPEKSFKKLSLSGLNDFSFAQEILVLKKLVWMA